MLKPCFILISFLTIFTSLRTHAQTGSIAGVIIDESNKETLIGATILVEGIGNGSSTDLEGRFIIDNVPAGEYTITVSYVSYQTKNISNVNVEAGKTTTLDVTLLQISSELAPVIITTTYSQETVAAITAIQKNNISISDGISKDIIQRSPDKNTSDVLKRMSGTTLQDGKFAVIRGLNDRYNIALVNGNILPSTEPDRKTFSFDLFPSALLDNLFIYKTAQPDMPGDFAGGIILLTTRDIPDQSFISVSAGTSYNLQTTLKAYEEYTGGKKDWLGVDDGTRAIPAGLPSTEDYAKATEEEKAEFAKLFPNNWGTEKKEASPLDQSYQVAGGWVKPLGENKFGLIGALTYNNSRSTIFADRKDYDFLGVEKYDYDDTTYRQNILIGGLLNASFKVGDKHKFSLKNAYSINGVDNTTIRGGINYDRGAYMDNEYYDFISNRLFSTTLAGDHYLPFAKIKVKWTLGMNDLTRDQPNLRQSSYYKNLLPVFEADTNFQTFLFNNPTPDGSFQYSTFLSEQTLLGSLDISYPFILGNAQQTFKVGTLLLSKKRQFDAHSFGYVHGNSFPSNPDYYNIIALPRDEIFAIENISPDIFYIEDATLNSDTYYAEQANKALYAMFDNKAGDKVRIVWGARAEFFNQYLESFFNSGSSIPEPVVIETAKIDSTGLPFDFLPSINIIYSLTEKFNIRAAGSKTVVRPELRELAPFGFYDYENSVYVIGNDTLRSTDVYNADLRFEFYPGMGQILSASVFYKHFINPIEISKYSTGFYQQLKPINEDFAKNFGFELELRKNFSFISDKSFFKNLTFNANYAYIKSTVEVTDTAYYGVSERPLQGQSPFVVNAGLTYLNPETGFSITTLYNVIGRRINELGYKNYPDIYENPRPQLDAQASIPFLKNAGMVRLTFADILSKDAIYYQDMDESGKYEEDIDQLIAQINTGSKVSLSVSYKF